MLYSVLSILSQGVGDAVGGRGRGKGEAGARYRTGGLNNGSRKQFKSKVEGKVLKMAMYDPSTSRCWVWRGAVDWRD